MDGGRLGGRLAGRGGSSFYGPDAGMPNKNVARRPAPAHFRRKTARPALPVLLKQPKANFRSFRGFSGIFFGNLCDCSRSQVSGRYREPRDAPILAFRGCRQGPSVWYNLLHPMKKPFDDAEPPDTPFDISLRPPAFSEFAGQDKVRERLELLVAAAKGRGDVLEHVLLSGPPGLGKTTLAYIIAQSMGVNIKSTSGPVIEKAGDLAGLLTTLERGDLLFIDEIHRLQATIEEYLYPAMEDYKLDIIIDQGPTPGACG